jgi:predicted aconitase with swiveling domain
MIRARVLHAGEATGPVVALDEPLSFWGAFEPRTGLIIDVHHPQRGAALAGTILLMRESRGSGSAPGAIAEAIRRETAPAAIVTIVPDVNLAIGAAVAAHLYGRRCPVLSVGESDYVRLAAAVRLHISAAGEISGFSV